MKGKALLLTVIAVAIMIMCFIVYNTYNNTEVKSEQLAVVFPMGEMVSVDMFEETINDLYKEMQIKAKTAEEESDTQEIVEADEMSSDAENEEILLTDESTENVSEPQISNPSGGDTKPAPQPSGGGTGPGGVDLDAIRAALGQTEGYSGPTGTLTGESGGGSVGITMAQ
ncbi:MAG: hypothetical protein K2K46_01985 [Lachnospiraceae bacterium]|nr:hypothetical protein [Lachnospiraceae bacterium]